MTATNVTAKRHVLSDSTADLPEGWAATSMGEVSEVIGGGTPKSSDPSNFTPKGYPWLTPADLGEHSEIHISRGRRDLTEQGLRTSSARLMPAGTVLMSSRAPIGYVAIAANQISTNQGFKNFVSHPDTRSEYLYFWLRFMTPVIESMGSGSTFTEISGSRCKEIPLVLAPLAEQKRIVQKVEQLLAQVDGARERLAKVLEIMKRFRQSVLAAACCGQLTADWRDGDTVASHEDWGTLSLVETQRLPEIPDSWTWTNVSEVATVRGGIQKQPKRLPKDNAFPYLRVANVLRNRLDLSEVCQMELFADELETYRLEPGDLLIIEGNGSQSEIGRSALWGGEIEDCVHQNHIIRVRSQRCLPAYLNAFWNSPTGRGLVARSAVTTSGLFSLSTRKVKSQPVPLAPLEEQREIVQRVEVLFALADAIEERVASAAERAEKLTQSILAKAFRGELVPTEAELARREGRSFESAAELLVRVKADREMVPASAHNAKTQGVLSND